MKDIKINSIKDPGTNKVISPSKQMPVPTEIQSKVTKIVTKKHYIPQLRLNTDGSINRLSVGNDRQEAQSPSVLIVRRMNPSLSIQQMPLSSIRSSELKFK
jgi:hypothetical protein